MKMKRFYVILSAVALTLSASAQDINISGKPCVGTDQTFEYTLANRYESFEWNFGDGATSSERKPVHKYTAAGTYTVKVTASGANGENADATTSITINNPPVIAFSCDTVGYKTVDFKIITTSTLLKNTWKFGDGSTSNENNPNHKYSAPGSYNVGLTSVDNNGCTSSVDSTITIVPSSKVPNVFTPNGDGRNDYFMISCSEGSRLKLEIFNRWGYKMFSRSGTENIVWDGYNPQGTLVSPGTYFYVITVEEGTTNYDPLNGYITVYY